MSDVAQINVLGQGTGYGVVIGIGLAFAVLLVSLTELQKRYTGYDPNRPEEFSTASHSIKPGLIGAGIVSAWTWAATLLQSSAVGYRYGLSGPYWYAAGATVQVLLFAQNTAKIKMNAPGAHTYLEVISTRWGTSAHAVFMFFGFATNILVSSMLILGGAATVNALTGMNTLACCFLTPVGPMIYVLVGGMRATLLCDYVHAGILYSIILAFFFVVYATSSMIGSPEAMYDLLQSAAAAAPVADNAEGSYVTFSSVGGVIFGIINVIGNFGTVFLDQSYWQRAIASVPETAIYGFILGGTSWTAVPLGFATTLGLAAVALQVQLPAAAVSAGLPAPAAAVALLGESGARTILVLLYLAVTSTTSAELVAVSSIVTFDVYKRYINPTATDKQVSFIQRATVVATGIAMGLLGLIFFYIGISMGWLYLFMGCVIGCAVIPVALSIMSSRANKWGCIGGAVAGFCSALIAWLVTTSAMYGELTVETTGSNYPMLAGNLASLLIGGVVSVTATLIWPEHYDWKETRAIGFEHMSHSTDSSTDNVDDKKAPTGDKTDPEHVHPVGEFMPSPKLRRAFKIALFTSVALFIILIILVPIPLLGAWYVWPEPSFKAWVVIIGLWIFYGAFATVIYPAFEAREIIGVIVKGIWTDITTLGKGKKQVAAPSTDSDSS